jgi:septal ring factor EnvC (AmiA/AmiB activator)
LRHWPLALLFALLPLPVAAASLEETQATLAQVQDTLGKANAKAEEITAALAAAVKAEADLSDRMVATSASIREQQAALATLDQKIIGLQQLNVVLESDLAEHRKELSDLLAGLVHLQQDPPPALAVSPEDVLGAVRSAMVFGAVVPDVKDKAAAVKAQIDDLARLRADIAVQKSQREAALAALAKSQDDLQQLQAEKHAFVAATQQDLAAEQDKAKALAAQAGDLQDLLSGLQKERAAADQRRSAQALALAAAAAKAEADRQAAALGPPKILSTLKGKLAYPVRGQIIASFGDDGGNGAKVQGTAIATAAQAIVNSPVDGTVEFAGPFKAYGQLLILDAGEGYLVLLAGLNHISAEMGQTVRIGEPVGTMGDGPSGLALTGTAASQNRPVFYVEFRKGNEAVDSTPWWDAAQKEAMK